MRGQRVLDSDSSRSVRAKAVRGTAKSSSETPQRPIQPPLELSKPCNLSFSRPASLQRPGQSGARPPGMGLTVSPGQRSPLRARQVVSATNSSGRDVPPPAANMMTVDNQKIALSIGIETEFILEPRYQKDIPDSYLEFLGKLAQFYNVTVDPKYARLYAPDPCFPSDIMPLGREFQQWILEEEPTIMNFANNPGRYSVEMKSPKFQPCQTPEWKDHVRKTWAFLEKHCRIKSNRVCSTHVHVSVRRGEAGASGMGLADMKKVAQCAIHFEPALEALVPQERRGNPFASSNWIDNTCFADESSTRQAVIQQIKGCTAEKQLIELMCPTPPHRNFAWNFHSITTLGTIEYRKGSASLSADDAIAWAELVILFVEAALQLTDVHSLRNTPANIGALKSFLGPPNLDRLGSLLHGKSDGLSTQPKRLLAQSSAESAMLEHKLADDAARQKQLAKRQQQQQ